MKENLKVLLNLFVYILSKILSIIPRKTSLWAFGASGGFRDNPKYLFYEVIEKHPEIKPVWISHNKKDYLSLGNQGMPVAYWLSWKGIYYALRSKVYIVDHSIPNINRYLGGGAYYVNLWHGSSVKRVRWQNPDYYVKSYHLKDASEMRTSFRFKMLSYVTLGQKPNLCLAPSSIQLSEFFAPMMDIPKENCVVGVYPRSRLMIEGKEAALSFIRKHEPEETLDFVTMLSNYHKIFIYMPTWRNDGRDFIKQAGIDWQRINEAMSNKNELFILKLHPFTKLDISKLSQYSNICIYPPTSDVYTILPFIDCLITDYSSIYTDFLMMNKEIILYVFDYKEYLEGDCKLSDYDKYFVGSRANDFNQLMDIINTNRDCHVPKDKYKFLMNFFWDNNRCNIDIADVIKERIGLINQKDYET